MPPKMGDNVNHFDPLKELGFLESSNQWILYDDRLKKFFDCFAQNITKDNVLTELEALERDEIDLEKFDESQELQKLEEYLPGIMSCTEDEALLRSKELAACHEAEQDYREILELARATKSTAVARLSELEDKQNVLKIQEKQLLSICQGQAKQLETLEEENLKLYTESRNCFTKTQSPPLLFCHLPLEQYFMTCDSFLQFFNLYIQENYKIQDFLKFDLEDESEELSQKLKGLEDLLTNYFEKIIEERIKVRATKAMIDRLDVKEIHAINFNDIKREMNDMEMLTENHLRVENEILRSDLHSLIRKKSQQRIELVLYENTKHKFERASKRVENGKCLKKIALDALTNAELVWIAIQIDLERVSKRIDNSKRLSNDTQASGRRIKAMHKLNANVSNCDAVFRFLGEISDLLAKSSNGSRIESEAKACLYEYEKFCRLLTYALHNMVNGRAYNTSKEQLREAKRLESLLEPLIYDSPTAAPLMYNIDLLRRYFAAKVECNRIDSSVIQIRRQYQKNIKEKMEKEPFWKSSQLLWVWFLKEPKRLLLAIEEVKREASNIPAFAHAKNISGIKRK